MRLLLFLFFLAARQNVRNRHDCAVGRRDWGRRSLIFPRVTASRRRVLLLSSLALASLYCFRGTAFAQTSTNLPTVHVIASKAKLTKRETSRRPTHTAVQPAGETSEGVAARQLAAKARTFDTARNKLYTTVGTTSYKISHQTIQALPQGTNAPVEKVLLQAPGVSQDSAASGLLHVRNDHANVQYRINGIMLPDGVTGFGSVLDTDLIGSIALVTGALPAEFGMRTVGLIDMTTRDDVFNNSGSVSLYGGTQGTLEPSAEYGGTFGGNCPTTAPVAGGSAPPASTANCFGGVQYFFTGRYLQTTVGIENPTPAYNAIHDFSQQEKGFAYLSAFIDPTTRLSLIAGTANSAFQIPNVPGQPVGQMGNPPVTSASGITNFNSALLNENQIEDTQYGVLALQKSINGFDGQLSYFTRYNDLHFIPDPVGDLLLNGVASNINRESYTNGVQGDASYVINSAHTIRAGFTVSGEQTNVNNSSLVEPCTICDGTDNGAPEAITDNVSKLGWLAGVYVQDEWKINNQFTINGGLRFDQMWQYVDANQLSPRLSVTYNPFENTTFHAGYARYFTPPVLVEAAPANIALFNGTTGAPSAGQGNSPVLPERSHYFDAGVDQKIPFGCYTSTDPDCPALELGADAYYKIATDLIDNGNFGQALVLSAFNYAEGITEGVEFSAKYHNDNFQAYGNLAVGQEKATDVVSNQYLFDNTTPLADLGGLTEYQYIQTHWIYTDHTQIVTGSAGVSYLWNGTRFSTDMIYGSGLRTGDANISTEAPYAQFNAGISHEFSGWDMKPLTLRFDVVNLFDTVYQIRSGTGVGVFAPQYGPRRGFFAGLTQKF
jgi:outer membrane receptor protein involved in Fe transport